MIDSTASITAANYPASQVMAVDPVPPPSLIDPSIPNGFAYSNMPDLSTHPAIPAFPYLAPSQGYTIDNATLQHPKPKYVESGYTSRDPITYRSSALGLQQRVYLPSQHGSPTPHAGIQGGQGTYSRRGQKRAYADSDASEEGAYTNKRQRLPEQDTGKGKSTKLENCRSIEFDGNSTEPDANPVSFLV